MRVTVALRRPGAACIAVNADMVGIAPPRPIPAKARSNINCDGPDAHALATENTAAIAREVSNIALRPKRSAAQPIVVAPRAAPAYELAKISPKAPGASAHSLEMSGAMNDNISVS